MGVVINTVMIIIVVVVIIRTIGQQFFISYYFESSTSINRRDAAYGERGLRVWENEQKDETSKEAMVSVTNSTTYL